MAQITYVQPDGTRQTFDIPDGSTVMEGAIDNDVDGIVASCGGGCACSTCHVYIDAEWQAKVGPAEGPEEATLEFGLDVKPSSRLSCQVQVSAELDGLVVHVAEQAD